MYNRKERERANEQREKATMHNASFYVKRLLSAIGKNGCYISTKGLHVLVLARNVTDQPHLRNILERYSTEYPETAVHQLYLQHVVQVAQLLLAVQFLQQCRLLRALVCTTIRREYLL